MKRALVSGSAGFIGRHMVRELESRGYEVEKVDLMAIPPIDALLLFTLPYAGPVFDLVVHCAYHVGGRAAIDGRNMNFSLNLQLDAACFDWAQRTRQKRVLYFSSSAAYPVKLQSKWHVDNSGSVRPDLLPLHESRSMSGGLPTPDPILADANYGFAKAVGERLAEDARKNGLAVTVVRPFSGYGEDQAMSYPFPSIVARARAGDLSVWGPKGQTRDWIHVSDVCAGALSVVESETTDPVNLCTGRGVEMGELACMIKRATTPHGLFNNWKPEHDVTYLEDKPTGVFYRVGDPTRFNQYYTPKISLEEGIQRALKVLR